MVPKVIPHWVVEKETLLPVDRARQSLRRPSRHHCMKAIEAHQPSLEGIHIEVPDDQRSTMADVILDRFDLPIEWTL